MMVRLGVADAVLEVKESFIDWRDGSDDVEDWNFSRFSLIRFFLLAETSIFFVFPSLF